MLIDTFLDGLVLRCAGYSDVVGHYCKYSDQGCYIDTVTLEHSENEVVLIRKYGKEDFLIILEGPVQTSIVYLTDTMIGDPKGYVFDSKTGKILEGVSPFTTDIDDPYEWADHIGRSFALGLSKYKNYGDAIKNGKRPLPSKTISLKIIK